MLKIIFFLYLLSHRKSAAQGTGNIGYIGKQGLTTGFLSPILSTKRIAELSTRK